MAVFMSRLSCQLLAFRQDSGKVLARYVSLSRVMVGVNGADERSWPLIVGIIGFIVSMGEPK